LNTKKKLSHKHKKHHKHHSDKKDKVEQPVQSLATTMGTDNKNKKEEEEFEKVKGSDAKEILRVKEKEKVDKKAVADVAEDKKRVKDDGLIYKEDGTKVNTGDSQVVGGVNNYAQHGEGKKNKDDEETEKVKATDAKEVLKAKEADKAVKAEIAKFPGETNRTKSDGLVYRNDGTKVDPADGQVVKGVNNYAQVESTKTVNATKEVVVLSKLTTASNTSSNVTKNTTSVSV